MKKVTEESNIKKDTTDVVVLGYGRNNPPVFSISQDKSGVLRYFSSGTALQPLFIVDGKEISRSDFEKLDAEEIESVSVLKNESAVKIYGEKGKNGVFLITMKKVNNLSIKEQEIDITM